MKIKEIIHEIENFAPLKFQESYDNSGVQVGDTTREAVGVLLCVDVTEAVLEEAIEKNCNLIISHHPLIFSGIKKIIPDNGIGKIIFKAIENHITIYSSHTNMDKAPKGVSYQTAAKLGVIVEKPLVPEKEDERFGLGIIGELPKEMKMVDFLEKTKKILNLGNIRHSEIPQDKTVKKIALCGGSAFEFYKEAIAAGADLYLTADIKYHQYFEPENRIILADIGHYESEQFVKEIFYDIVSGLNSKINAKFALLFSERPSNPINYL